VPGAMPGFAEGVVRTLQIAADVMLITEFVGLSAQYHVTGCRVISAERRRDCCEATTSSPFFRSSPAGFTSQNNIVFRGVGRGLVSPLGAAPSSVVAALDWGRFHSMNLQRPKKIACPDYLS
jgi:hypothetical protein